MFGGGEYIIVPHNAQEILLLFRFGIREFEPDEGDDSMSRYAEETGSIVSWPV